MQQNIESRTLQFLLVLAYPLWFFVIALAAMAVDALVQGVIDYSFRGRSANPWAAGAVYTCLGAAGGYMTAGLFPHRLFGEHPLFNGVSLILAPIGTGLFMHYYGLRKNQSAGDSSWLATFWGGALFAFAVALARWSAVSGG